jgi:hypothetical protein
MLELRHYCRNPHCRSKLPAPTDNPRKAFCTKGCHGSFYLKRCVVCENEKPAGSTVRRKLCRRPSCESNYRQNRGLYSFPGADVIRAANTSRNPIKTGIKSGGVTNDRPWRIVAGPVISATVFQFATLPLDPDTTRRVNAANDFDRIRLETAWGRPAERKMLGHKAGAP